MKKLIGVILFALLLTAYVQADSTFTPMTIDLSIIPGKTGEPLHEAWYDTVQARFCPPSYPPGDANCDGKINPVDVVLIINRVYLGYAFPECK